MPQPFNYVQQVQSPVAAMLQGYQAGTAIQDRRREEEMLRQQQEQNAQFREAFQKFAVNPNPSLQDYLSLSSIAPPAMVKPLSDAYAALSDQGKQASRKRIAETISVLRYGDPQMAIDYFNSEAEAAKNAGRMDQAQAAIMNRQLVEQGQQEALEKQILMQAVVTEGLGPEFVKAIGSLEPARKLQGVPDTWDRIGLIRKVFQNGDIEYRRNGELVTPEAALPLIVAELDRERDRDLEDETEKAIALSNISAVRDMGQEAVSKIETAREQISLLERARSEIQKLVDSGEYSRDPDAYERAEMEFEKLFNQSFIILKSIGANLALGLGERMSGAMSDNDVKFISQGSLPTDLAPPNLLDFVNNSIAAQRAQLQEFQTVALQAATNPQDYVALMKRRIGPMDGALVITPEPEE
jgi:hypothetical protein